MTDYGELDPARGEADLEVAFSPNDRQEFMRLFKLQPGAEFNLSATEIGSIRERLGAGPTGREANRMLRRPIASCSPGACAGTASAD